LARVRAINPHAKFQSAQGHAESLHNLLTGDVSSVHAVECEEEEDDEGFVNMAEGEYECGRNERWKTPDYSWLDLEEEEDLTMYHVNVVIDEDRANNYHYENNKKEEEHAVR
jgi:hypothetical protein